MRRFLSTLMVVPLLSTTVGSGQTVIPPDRTKSLEGIHSTAGESVLLFATHADGESVTVVASQRTAPGTGVPVRVVVTGANAARTYALTPILPEPVVLFQSQLIYTRHAAGGHETWTLSVASGNEQRLKLSVKPVLVAVNQDRVVMIGPGTRGAFALTSLDRGLRPTDYELPSITQAQLYRSLLSFDAKGRLLLIDRSEAAYVPITFGDTVGLAPRVNLAGPEVDLSRKLAKPSKGLSEQLIVSHSTSKSGNDLFFLGPYKLYEYRIAEFDAQGRQVNAYRLQAEKANPPSTTALSSRTIASTADAIEIVSVDGTKRTYWRP